MRIRATFPDAFRKQSPPLKSMPWARGFFCLAVLVAIPCSIGISQSGAAGGDNQLRNSSGIPPISPLANRTADPNRIMADSMQTPESRKRLEQLNLLRQKEMTDETARLVRLANEVKSETGQGTTDSLTVVELRKVELIEKLAKSVREKMKATVAN
jgi:hypothetical protein